MAIRGQWTGTTTSLNPTTTWAAPNGLFSTEAVNDDSTYSFTDSTATVTLASSGLPNGYLILAAFELEHSGRSNPQGRLVQASGTGTFVCGGASGYTRQASDDRAYVRTWAFIDNPSASATIQFQWRRDDDTPTGGTVRSSFEVIPLYYDNHGIYSSTSTSCPGGDSSPNQLTGWTVEDESDTAAIELSSNVVTLKSLNKRYLAFGSQYWQGIGNARTQRWHGFRLDGTKDDTAKTYTYARYATCADIGAMFTTPIVVGGSTRTVDQFVWRGEARDGFPEEGADQDGNTTGSNPSHAMVILELPDSAELFHGQNISLQNLNVAGTRVDMNLAETVNVADSASFTKSSDTAVNVEQDMDMLLGANISGGYTTQANARATVYAAAVIDGTEDTYNFHGNFGRGDSGTQDCYGWGATILGAHSVSDGDTFGVNAGKISGSESGAVAALQDSGGYWALNLDSLAPSSVDLTVNASSASLSVETQTATVTKDRTVSAGAASLSVTTYPASITKDRTVSVDTTSLTVTTQAATVTKDRTVSIDTTSLSVQTYAASIVKDRAVSAGAASLSVQTYPATVDTASNLTVDVATATLTVTTYPASIQIDRGVAVGSVAMTVQTYPATVSTTADLIVDVATAAMTVQTYPATVTKDRTVTAGVASLDVTTYPATISTTADLIVDAATAALTVTTYPATVTKDRTVSADVASLSVTTYPATVDTESNLTVSVSTAALTVTTYPASIQIDRGVAVGSAALSITTYPASVGKGRSVDVGTVGLTVTTYRASVLTEGSSIARVAEADASRNVAVVQNQGDPVLTSSGRNSAGVSSQDEPVLISSGRNSIRIG